MGSKLKQTDKVFVILRLLTLFGGLIWVKFYNNGGEIDTTSLYYLLSIFTIYSCILCIFIKKKPSKSKTYYRYSLVFDLIFITILIKLTGGVYSQFYLSYYLLITLHTFYFSSLYIGMGAGFFALILYIFVIGTERIELYWGDLAFRLVFFILVAISAGYIALEFNKYNQKLKSFTKQLAETNHLLDKKLNQITSLYEVSKVIGSTHQLDEIIKLITDLSSQLLNAPITMILLQENGDNNYTLKASKGLHNIEKFEFKFNNQLKEELTSKSKEVLVIKDEFQDVFKFSDNIDFESMALIVPLFINETINGMLVIIREQLNEYNNEEIKLSTVIASLASAAIDKANLYEQTRKLSITDGLTGLFNFRYFSKQIELEIKRAERYNNNLSLIIADIDFFKKINDTYGHTKGDIVLKHIAQILKLHTRETDLVARYGGEEFVILLPETNSEEALIVAERIRKEVEEYRFPLGNNQFLENVTVSLGISYTPLATSAEELIQKADQALYKAKYEGRNKICKN